MRRMTRGVLTEEALTRAVRGFGHSVRQHRAFLRRAAGDVLRIAGTVGLAQVIAFAASPLLTRLYTPEAFGHFAMLGTIVTILTPLVSLRYAWALPLPRDEEVARDLLALAVLVTFGVTVTVGIVGALAWMAPQDWIEIRIVDVVLLAVALLAIGLHDVAINWLLRNQTFSQIAALRFATLVGTALCQLVFALIEPGATGLMLGFIGGYLLGCARAAQVWRHTVTACVHGLADLHRLRRVAVDHRQFAVLSAPSGVVNGVGRLLPNIVLPSLYGLAVVGQWSLTQRVLWQPIALVGQAANQVFLGNAARLQTQDPGQLWLLFLIITAALFAAMAPGVILIWYGPAIFALVFGPGWEQAGRFAGIVVLSGIFTLASQGTACLHVYGLNRWMSSWEVARLLLVAWVCSVVWWLGLSPICEFRHHPATHSDLIPATDSDIKSATRSDRLPATGSDWDPATPLVVEGYGLG